MSRSTVIRKKDPRNEKHINVASAFEVEYVPTPTENVNYSEEMGYFISRSEALAMAKYVESSFDSTYNLVEIYSGWGLMTTAFLELTTNEERYLDKIISYNNKDDEEITKNNIKAYGFVDLKLVKFGKKYGKRSNDEDVIFLNPKMSSGELSGAEIDKKPIEKWINNFIKKGKIAVFVRTSKNYVLGDIYNATVKFREFKNSKIFKITPGADIKDEEGPCFGEKVSFYEDVSAIDAEKIDFFGKSCYKTAEYYDRRGDEWSEALSTFVGRILSEITANDTLVDSLSFMGDKEYFDIWRYAFTTPTYDIAMGDEFTKLTISGNDILRSNFNILLEREMPDISSDEMSNMINMYLSDEYLKNISVNKGFHNLARVVGLDEFDLFIFRID